MRHSTRSAGSTCPASIYPSSAPAARRASISATSLRPHTMEGRSALNKSVLHHTGNTLPIWFLECLGIFTSLANACGYSVAHHFAGLSHLLKDQPRADAIFRAL